MQERTSRNSGGLVTSFFGTEGGEFESLRAHHSLHPMPQTGRGYVALLSICSLDGNDPSWSSETHTAKRVEDMTSSGPLDTLRLRDNAPGGAALGSPGPPNV